MSVAKKKRKVNLKKKLWDIFSKVIRMRDADDNGNVKCISCDKKDHWKNLQAGHCIPKSLGIAIYFDERNVRPQCSYCNLAEQGNQYKFMLALEKIYGSTISDDLQLQRKNICQIKAWEYEELIEKYQKELINLEARQPLSGIIFGSR